MLSASSILALLLLTTGGAFDAGQEQQLHTIPAHDQSCRYPLRTENIIYSFFDDLIVGT